MTVVECLRCGDRWFAQGMTSFLPIAPQFIDRPIGAVGYRDDRGWSRIARRGRPDGPYVWPGKACHCRVVTC